MAEIFSIGVDIGGTNTAYGIVADSGKIIHEKWWQTQSFPTVEDLAKAIFEDIKTLSDIDFEAIRGIGIGAPSANSETGCIHHSANLNWKGIVPIQQVFETLFGLPCTIANDANTAAMGEKIYGDAKDLENFVVITIGTGLGAGIMCNGKLISGFDGNGGEFGHIVVEYNGRPCGCGRNGCLETYTSASGIKKTAQILADSGKYKTGLNECIQSQKDWNSQTVFEYVLAGDEMAKAVFEHTGNYLGAALANLVTLLGLEKIFLFGGPVKAGEILLQPIQKTFDEQVIFYYKGKVKIKITALNERDAAILGAAAMVQYFGNKN